jgi:hypothetical protein
MNIATGREPLARPAMPIDIAAPAYHSSALKITRRIFFLADLAADLARAVVFLALADLEVLFFGIFAPLLPGPRWIHHSRGHSAVTVAPKKSLTLYGVGMNFINI